MPTKLLSLYIRAGTGAVRLALRLTERAVALAGSAVGLADRDGAGGGAEPGEVPGVVPRADEAVETPARAQAAPRAHAIDAEAVDYEAEPATPLDPAEELAKTIDEEAELVEELAEPGAEDGAGAEIDVEEPWEGYGGMNAEAVIARLREASAAELAMVELYERGHRQRKTVLAAAEKRHKEISGPREP